MRFATLLVMIIAGIGSLWAKSEPKQPDTYAYNRGVEAFDEGNFQDAHDWFIKELADHPDNGYAYLYLSLLRYANNEYGSALSDVNNSLKKLPKNAKTFKAASYRARATIYLATNDTVKALEDYSSAIKETPEDRDLYSERAQLYFEQEKYSLSDADYLALIKMNEGDAFAYVGIARNALEQNRNDDALEALDKSVMYAPDFSEGYAFRAMAYSAKEQWAEATDDIIKALSIDANGRAYDLMPTLPKSAAELLKQKLKIQMLKEPNIITWPYCLATIEQENEDYQAAISHYSQAYDIDANAVFLQCIAQCYLELQNHAKAMENVERAIAMSPQDYELVALKANILQSSGQYDEAIAELDKCLAQYPEDVLSYLKKADILMDTRRYSEAIENYNMVTLVQPLLAEFPYLLVKRGDAYRLAGKIGEAVADYQKLLAAENDTSEERQIWIPFAYSALGNADKAIETMQYVLDNDTTDVVGSLYNAACVYARLNKKTEALKYLREAVTKGYSYAAHINSDYDLDCLRNMPEFKAICERIPAEEEEVTVVMPDDKASDSGNTETVEVPFTKENGVTKVKCAINGLPLHFVFDTGASEVTMSLVEANFMLKNDYIKPSDIIGTSHYIDANGDISEGTVINLRSVNFGGLELENVRATVVRNQRAPLLLGQSVLGRLGKIEIDNPGLKLKITHKTYK